MSSYAELQRAIDALHEHMALLDDHWNILAVNQSWDRAARQFGHHDFRKADNYRSFALRKAAEGDLAAKAAVRGIEEIDSGRSSRFRHVYPGEGPAEGHFYETIIVPFYVGRDRLILVTRYDVTELHKLRKKRRQLSNRLLHSQEQERRLIARDLHDSTSQLLSVLQLDLARLERIQPDEQPAVISHMEEVLDRVQQEIRSLSFLFHPPGLDDRGLAEALKVMAEGFGQRTGLKVSFDAGTVAAQSRVAEEALFIVAQEALANVHRHAQASLVSLSVVATKTHVHLIIADDGVGIDGEGGAGPAKAGVGIAGMQERMHDLGGRLIIRSTEKGTTIIASMVRFDEQLVDA